MLSIKRLKLCVISSEPPFAKCWVAYPLKLGLIKDDGIILLLDFRGIC